ncbi:MAG: CPBP family intramembrane metalloprotease [Anaerolineales bacterium]
MLELLIFGGLWEEIGWSGYALPKLQARFANRPNGSLMAALVLGIFRAIWHLPLYMYGTIYWFDILMFEVAVQVIIAWLYNRSGGRVLAIMVFHYTSNLMGAATSSVFNGIERTNYYTLFMGLAALIAIVFAWQSQLKPGVGRYQESEPSM